MLNDEDGFHLVLTAFSDGERFVFERVDGTRGGDVNCDVGSTLDFLEVACLADLWQRTE